MGYPPMRSTPAAQAGSEEARAAGETHSDYGAILHDNGFSWDDANAAVAVLDHFGLLTPVAPQPELDVAWKEAEAALPEGAHVTAILREEAVWRAYASKTEVAVRPSEYGMRFVGGWSRSWKWDGNTGPTPAAALLALAAALRTPKPEGEAE